MLSEFSKTRSDMIHRFQNLKDHYCNDRHQKIKNSRSFLIQDLKNRQKASNKTPKYNKSRIYRSNKLDKSVTDRQQLKFQNAKICERIHSMGPILTSFRKLESERKRSLKVVQEMRRNRNTMNKTVSRSSQNFTIHQSKFPRRSKSFSTKKDSPKSDHQRDHFHSQRKVRSHSVISIHQNSIPKKSKIIEDAQAILMKNSRILSQGKNIKIEQLRNYNIHQFIESLQHRQTPILLYRVQVTLQSEEGFVSIERQHDSYHFRIVFNNPVFGAHLHEIIMKEEDGKTFFDDYDYDYQRIVMMLGFSETGFIINIPEAHYQKIVEQNQF